MNTPVVFRSALTICLLVGFGVDSPAGDQVADSNRDAVRRIFRCESQGRVTYSDTACATAPDKTAVAAEQLNTYAAIDPPQKVGNAANVKRPATRPARDDSIATEQLRAKQRCQRLADRLATIEVKMRTGYTAPQGERLREQRRQLEQQRRTEKCR